MRISHTSRKSRLLAGAAALALACSFSTGALAQDADEDTADEEDIVVVTGIRSSIRNSLDVKKNSTSIVEAVSAEDIGKLPDVSIAESIARLPGLAAQRLRGRAQVISVRGLGPDFTTALLNGREQVTAGDNRGVEFDQYPSELLNSVIIYKTPDASLLGQGLAGTADLQTIRPLTHGKRTVSVSGRYEWNDQGALNAGSNDDGYRLTGTYIDVADNGRAGWAIGGALQSSPTQAERWDAWGYPSTGAGELIIGGAKPYVESRDLERQSVFGTVEFEPNEDWSLTFDVFGTHFEDSGILRGLEIPLFWSGAQLQPGYTIDNGLVTAGTFNNVVPIVRNDARSREADLISLGGNVQHQLTDKWAFEADLSYSAVERKDRDLETYSGTGFAGSGAADIMDFRLGSNGNFVFDSQVDYADPSQIVLTDPGGWGQVGFIKEPTTDDELQALRLSAERSFENSFLDSVEFGVNRTQRKKKKRSEEAFLDLAPGLGNEASIPADLLIGSTELEFLGIPGMVSYDPNAMLLSGVYQLRPNQNADVLTKAWDVREEVTTAYVQANVMTDLNQMPLTGNFGVQYVQTDQSSTGVGVGNGFLQQIDLGDEYSNILPSANFSLEVMDNTFVRAAAARTLARARMDQLSASSSGGPNGQICGVTAGMPFFNANLSNPGGGQACFGFGGGNPQLQPYEADAFDLSFEKYFGEGDANIVAAVFHKEINNWIDGNTSVAFDATQIVDQYFTGLGYPDFTENNPGIGDSYISAPSNTDGGWLQGIELSTNLPGTLISPALDGFGVYASYSYTDSEIDPLGNGAIQIPGLSESVANGSVYFEKSGFQSRLSYRYRSEFLGEVTGFGAGREFRSVDAEGVLDGQIGYTFEDGPLEGLGVLLQAYNLTDEDFTTFLNGDERQVKDYQSYGRSFLLGVNYRFN